MGVVTVCSTGADFAYLETYAWPASSAFVSFSLAFISRDPVFALLFEYLWESFEYFILFMYQRLAADVSSPTAQWLVTEFPESSLNGGFPAHIKNLRTEPCIVSPAYAFLLNPIIFFSSICLWSIACEKLIGAHYDHERAFGVIGRRVVYYAAVLFRVLFASTNLFVRINSSDETKKVIGHFEDTTSTQFDPDIGSLMTPLIFLCLAAAIPVRAAQVTGSNSHEARRAYFAYIVYALFTIFMVLVSILGGPFLNIQSCWFRTLIAVGVLWISASLVSSVRLGIALRRKFSAVMYD